MSTGFTLSAAAFARHQALKRSGEFAVKIGAKTADQVWDEYVRDLAALLREARAEVDDDRMISTKCADCQKVHTMKADVARYRCPCNPYRDRLPFTERVELQAEDH